LVSRIFASWNQLDGWLRQMSACSNDTIAGVGGSLALLKQLALVLLDDPSFHCSDGV
jgi:hypothetical protein